MAILGTMASASDLKPYSVTAPNAQIDLDIPEIKKKAVENRELIRAANQKARKEKIWQESMNEDGTINEYKLKRNLVKHLADATTRKELMEQATWELKNVLDKQKTVRAGEWYGPTFQKGVESVFGNFNQQPEQPKPSTTPAAPTTPAQPQQVTPGKFHDRYGSLATQAVTGEIPGQTNPYGMFGQQAVRNPVIEPKAPNRMPAQPAARQGIPETDGPERYPGQGRTMTPPGAGNPVATRQPVYNPTPDDILPVEPSTNPARGESVMYGNPAGPAPVEPVEQPAMPGISPEGMKLLDEYNKANPLVRAVIRSMYGDRIKQLMAGMQAPGQATQENQPFERPEIANYFRDGKQITDQYSVMDDLIDSYNLDAQKYMTKQQVEADPTGQHRRILDEAINGRLSVLKQYGRQLIEAGIASGKSEQEATADAMKVVEPLAAAARKENLEQLDVRLKAANERAKLLLDKSANARGWEQHRLAKEASRREQEKLDMENAALLAAVEGGTAVWKSQKLMEEHSNLSKNVLTVNGQLDTLDKLYLAGKGPGDPEWDAAAKTAATDQARFVSGGTPSDALIKEYQDLFSLRESSIRGILSNGKILRNTRETLGQIYNVWRQTRDPKAYSAVLETLKTVNSEYVKNHVNNGVIMLKPGETPAQARTRALLGGNPNGPKPPVNPNGPKPPVNPNGPTPDMGGL